MDRPQKRATILVRRIDPFTPWEHNFEYIWEGPEDGVVFIANVLLIEKPDLLKTFPWEMEIVGYDPTMKTWFVQRKEFSMSTPTPMPTPPPSPMLDQFAQETYKETGVVVNVTPIPAPVPSGGSRPQ